VEGGVISEAKVSTEPVDDVFQNRLARQLGITHRITYGKARIAVLERALSRLRTPFSQSTEPPALRKLQKKKAGWQHPPPSGSTYP
jgi:hypothetical protein